MNKHIASKLMSLLSRRELKERLAKVAMVLSCFAVFCITYILVAPVLTEEWPAVCGMEEHTHDDSCYEERLVQPEPELICGLEETGHVHTDACYEMRRGDLMCTETGTEEEPHVHDDSCYAWNYELVCTESTEGHIHDESCYAEPAEPYMERVLICELPEHTHTDSCYHVPEENPAPDYICGFSVEHTHTEECYFEDGSLKCTVPEHIHTEDCVAKELPELGENEELMPVDEQFTYENEEVTVTFTVQGEIPVAVAETEEIETVETAEPVETTEPVLELAVTESENQEAYNEYEELATEDGDVMLMQVLDYSLTLDGTPVDLGRCEVTTEVTPKPELQQMMDSPMPLMTYAAEAEDMEDESSETETFMELTTYSESNGEVAYAVIAGANPSFTVQYYAYLERVTTADGTKGTELPVINTAGAGNGTGGNLPKNGVDPATTNLYLNDDKKITTTRTLTQIYETESFKYVDAPGLRYINIILTNQKSNYELKEIWVWNNAENDWDKHTYDSKTTRITNRPQTAEVDSNFILITEDSKLRMIYEPKIETEKVNANFYDYDITDGKIYSSEADARSQENGKEVTTQTNATAYANVNQQGINSHGKVLGFGNSNVPTGMGSKTWNQHGVSNTPNQANGKGFKGCTFGLVQNSLDGDIIRYNVSSPALFNEEKVTGKTEVTDRKLGFSRVGDTWTLSSVVQGTENAETTLVSNLETFQERWNWNQTVKMYGNDFWPLDALAGTESHDLKFGLEKSGSVSMAGRRRAVGANSVANFPSADFPAGIGYDHNAYFGMQFGVEFSLTNSYVGPLEYYFFGDDDMWVYLVDTETGASKLICDIGGVHSAVGEYVDLWDYIDKTAFYEKDEAGNIKLDEAGNPIEKKGDPKLDENDEQKLDKNGNPLYEDYIKKYELRFYYTERGASGSTCWMQFTLPTVVGLDLETLLEEQVEKDTGSLWIQKELSGIENTQDFVFKLNLSGDAPDNYMVMGANGELLEGENALEYIANGDTFKLQAGDILVIKGLPKDTTYTIEELTTDGYHTEITTTVGKEEKVESGSRTSGTITVNNTTKVIYTNHATYELPATGGSGTVLWYTIGGILVLTGLCLLVYNNKQKRGRATI